MTAATPRRIERVRHEIHRRELKVARIQELSPGFLAITLAGDALAGFISSGFDDHLKFMFDSPEGEPIRRDYTPRHYDAERNELVLEFALHQHGQAARWAREAVVGQTAVIAGPRGSMVIPMDYDWHLFVGDATALPAIHRRLEELPSGTRAMVSVLLTDPADQRELSSAADLELEWVDSNEALLESLRKRELPAGEGFAWSAGEASVMTQVRDILIDQKGHPKQAMRVAAYWRKGAEGVHEELTPMP